MKTQNNTILLIALVLSSSLYFYGCKSEPDCTKTPEKVYLKQKDYYVIYNGTEQLKFLHNNLDTQIFIGQGRETYFVSDNAVSDLGCAKDHESIRVKFLNQKTSDVLILAYEFDNGVFGNKPYLYNNPYTFYKLSYKGKLFINELTSIDTSYITINNKKYSGYIAGNDTNNYIGYSLIDGFFRLRINSENWDIIQ